MTPPPWKPTCDEDRQRFTGFILAELDAADTAQFKAGLKVIAATEPANLPPEKRVAFIRAIAESGADAATTERLGWLFGMDIAQVADELSRLEEVGFVIKGAPGKPGVKAEHSKLFQNAIDDVPRIRALFGKHWGKRNRHFPPMAEEIAAERWNLSENERAALIDRFQRKGSVSQN